MIQDPSLLAKGKIQAFGDREYPAHISPIIAHELPRMARDAGLMEVEHLYSMSGKIPGMSKHFPRTLSSAAPRWFSDSLLMAGRRA